jgi:UDP-N-acetylglucosamine 2-epimerase (non-hydrolysing)
MKIMTILGTRPEIIRLSTIIPQLDKLSDHILVHTGQNFDKSLNNVFFEELGLRSPDYYFNTKTDSVMEQISRIIFESEKVIQKERPDRLLILGDTNSGMSAFVAKRMGIPVFHMEAGNRCYDDRVPEETNRRVIDHCSDILMPYTERSRDNLLREGIPSNRIYVTGNPIKEVLNKYSAKIDSSNIISRLKLQKYKYFLLTLHRAENVDIPERLQCFIEALEALAGEHKMPIICSLHPHTRAQLNKQKKELDENWIVPLEPLGLFDFISLEKNA